MGRGRTAVITGANTGIGKATAAGMLRHGYTVVLACRNPEKAGEAEKDLREQFHEGNIHVQQLDLASFESIRAAADNIRRQWPDVSVLINNAGGFPTSFTPTGEGFEFQFGVMHLGHFLLTCLLEPALAVPG